MNNDLFDIKVSYVSFKNPVAVASMSGITDSKFLSKFKEAGLLIAGGYNLDKETNAAAKKEIERGRTEFISDKPMEFLKQELEALKNLNTAISVNLRAVSLSPFIEAANIIKEYNAILEIDAHCRQPEMTEIGVGETLLKDKERLAEYIREIKKTGVVVSVKTRANIVNDVEISKLIESAKADIIHIDAMHPEGMDVGVIRRVRNSTKLFIIANNSITDFETAKEMFTRGADMVSLARETLKNPNVIKEIVRDVSYYQSMTGWYNSPKHICGGGDLRALAFCCLPVKPCAVHNALKQIGLTPQEFTRLKLDFTKGKALEPGYDTCFGSMAWCCKITKPCFFRDSVLARTGLSDVEYMKAKKELSEYILAHRKQ